LEEEREPSRRDLSAEAVRDGRDEEKRARKAAHGHPDPTVARESKEGAEVALELERWPDGDKHVRVVCGIRESVGRPRRNDDRVIERVDDLRSGSESTAGGIAPTLEEWACSVERHSSGRACPSRSSD
jgi:hypothetical protein